MKRIDYVFMLLILLGSCGVNRNNTEKQSDVVQENCNPSIQNCTSTQSMITVVIRIPPYGSVGAAPSVLYQNKSYLFSNNMNQALKQSLTSLPPGDHQRNVRATFGVESGLFPNPTVTFDVINISEVLN